MDHVLKGADDADTFARAARLKLDGVEVNLKVSDLRATDSPRRTALPALAERHGLSIPSCVLGEHNSGGIATWWRGPDADEEVRLALQWCGLVGATTLLVPFFFMNEPKGRAHQAAVAERLKPLCAAAERAGVVLAFEGVLRAAELRTMADRVASPAFGVYYDPANATWCDHDVPADVRLLGPLLRQTHVKDARTYTGDVRPGEGRADWAAFAAALQSINYDRWLVLETPAGEPAVVAADVAFARGLAAKVGGTSTQEPKERGTHG